MYRFCVQFENVRAIRTIIFAETSQFTKRIDLVENGVAINVTVVPSFLVRRKTSENLAEKFGKISCPRNPVRWSIPEQYSSACEAYSDKKRVPSQTVVGKTTVAFGI